MRQKHSIAAARRAAGFTLIELMVTILVGAILASIAVPAYQNQIRKSRRTDARVAVLDLASREERFLSTSNAYSQIPTDLGYSGANFPVTVGNGYYQVSAVSPDPAFVAAGGTGPSYIITATAIGLQLKDTACQTFSVNQLGQQTATDSTATATTACW